MISAIDVSSAQPRDLTGLIAYYQPEHVVVKLYQPTERISTANPTGAFAQDHSRAQIASALASGCTVGGYFWLYATQDPRQGIRAATALATAAGLDLAVLWTDIETYTDGTIPTAAQVDDAMDECAQLGLTPGVYTSPEMWRRAGNPRVEPHWRNWTALYNGRADLAVPEYGGWAAEQIVGHQFTSTPIDRSVFSEEATMAVPDLRPELDVLWARIDYVQRRTRSLALKALLEDAKQRGIVPIKAKLGY